MLLEVEYSLLIIYASIRTMPACGKTRVCFAHFFFKRGAGGLLPRVQEVRGEVIRRGGVTLFRRGCVKLLNTPPPFQTPHAPALPFFRACKNIAS